MSPTVHLCHQFMAHDVCYVLMKSSHTAGVSSYSDGTYSGFKACHILKEYSHQRGEKITILQSRIY